MNTVRAPLLLLGILAAAAVAAADDGKKKPASGFTLSKETTYVTGPLDEDGLVDYEAALNERLGKGITPRSNANVLLVQACGPRPQGGVMPPGFYQALGIKEPPERGAYFVSIYKYVSEHVKPAADEDRNAIYNQLTPTTQRPWKAKQYPHIATWLKLNEKPLVVAVEATKRPDYFNPLVSRKKKGERSSLIGALLPNAQLCRDMGSALSARAMLRVAEGRFDDAWQDLLACHRLGRLVGRGATLIEALVGIAIDTIASNASLAYLANAKLNARQIQDRLADLRKLPPMPAMADKVDLGERFMYLDTVMLLRHGGVKGLAGLTNGGGPKKVDAKAEEAFKRIDWDPALRLGNEWYDRLVKAMRVQGRAGREKQLDLVEQELKALVMKNKGLEGLMSRLAAIVRPDKVVSNKIGEVLVGLLIPAVRKVDQAADRSEQIQRNLHVAYALAAYRAEQGRYPEKLATLAPKYLPRVPGDIFSGKELIYRPAKGGYLLYSVGANGKDDGGRWHDDDPSGDDPRVRMPLPPLKPKG